MTLYFFVEKKLTIKLIIIFYKRYFKMNNKIKKSLILSRETLFLLTKIAIANVFFDNIF